MSKSIGFSRLTRCARGSSAPFNPSKIQSLIGGAQAERQTQSVSTLGRVLFSYSELEAGPANKWSVIVCCEHTSSNKAIQIYNWQPGRIIIIMLLLLILLFNSQAFAVNCWQ